MLRAPNAQYFFGGSFTKRSYERALEPTRREWEEAGVAEDEWPSECDKDIFDALASLACMHIHAF